MSRLIGHAETTFHASPQSIKLRASAGTTSLLDFCKAATPPCHLNPLLFNGHLQTFWTVIKSFDIPIYYKRRIFSAENPTFAGTFAVDFAVRPYDDSAHDESLPPRTSYFTETEFDSLASDDDESPMLVVLHGLSGGSHEVYLRQVLKPMLDAGWQACVVNSRGCAMSKITTGILYNARATWDVRQIVRWLRQRCPKRPLFGLGFSLGANILTNYLGEEGETCQLKAAVVISNPWNLDASSIALNNSFMGLEVYSRAMGMSMRKLFEEHVEQISKNPRIDVDKIRNIKYLYQFDREVQGPTWGYPTEGAYYRDASSCDSLSAIRIPLFAINANDDPIAVAQALPLQEMTRNPYTVLCTTSLGGHLSWFEAGGGRWFVKPASKFLLRMAQDIDLNSLKDVRGSGKDGDRQVTSPYGEFRPLRRKLEIPTPKSSTVGLPKL